MVYACPRLGVTAWRGGGSEKGPGAAIRPCDMRGDTVAGMMLVA